MSSPEPAPKLHNIEPIVPTFLVGVELVDAKPFGEALKALGVPEAEVPNWQVYSLPPSDIKSSDPAIVLFPHIINKLMMKDAKDGNERGRDWRFVQSFHKIAPRVILQTAAAQIASKRLAERNFAYRHRDRLANLAYLVGFLGGPSVIALYNEKQNVLATIAEGILTAAASKSVVQGVTSPVPLAKRLVRQALEVDSDLPHKLSTAILPKYNR